MSSQIQLSSPFLKSISHVDYTIGTSKVQFLSTPTNISEKRVVVIVQNKSSTATIQVIGNATQTVGLAVPPLGSITFDNYNGELWGFSSAAGTLIHIAISSV
jgi:hypothetical protein